MLPSFKSLTKGQVRRNRQNNFVMPVAVLVGLFLIGQAFWLSDNRFMFQPFSTVRIDCETCGKVGVIREPGNVQIKKMCPTCFGVGYHNIRRFDEMDAVCAACGGMGRTDIDGTWTTCERCEGRGVFRLNEWKEFVEIEPFQPTRGEPADSEEGTPVAP